MLAEFRSLNSTVLLPALTPLDLKAGPGGPHLGLPLDGYTLSFL